MWLQIKPGQNGLSSIGSSRAIYIQSLSCVIPPDRIRYEVPGPDFNHFGLTIDSPVVVMASSDTTGFGGRLQIPDI